MNAERNEWVTSRMPTLANGSVQSEAPAGRVKTQIGGLTPRLSDSVCLGGTRDCISHEFQARLLVQEAHSENHWHQPSVETPLGHDCCGCKLSAWAFQPGSSQVILCDESPGLVGFAKIKETIGCLFTEPFSKLSIMVEWGKHGLGARHPGGLQAGSAS